LTTARCTSAAGGLLWYLNLQGWLLWHVVVSLLLFGWDWRRRSDEIARSCAATGQVSGKLAEVYGPSPSEARAYYWLSVGVYLAVFVMAAIWINGFMYETPL
jgi:hypothetical protein